MTSKGQGVSENWTNLDKGRVGVRNPENFADVICTRPLIVNDDYSSPMSRVYYVTVLQMMPLVCLFLSLVVYLRLTGRRSPWFWLLPLVPDDGGNPE